MGDTAVVRKTMLQVILLLLSLVSVYAQQQLLATSTGSIQYTVTSVTAQQRWTIFPVNPISSRIQIVFTALQMQQAELRIFETSLVDSGTVLFNCASCGSLIPSPFYSSTGSITISITGIPGVGFTPSSFSLQYVASVVAPTTQLNNTYVTLNMGSGSIFPYTVNGQLPANYKQQWVIRQPLGTQIIFSFGKFSFGSDCSAQLQLFDGVNAGSRVLIYKGCTNADVPLGWLYSGTGAALVVLTSSGPGPASVDFQLNYFVDVDLFRCGSFVQPAVLADDSTIIADGSQSTNVMMRSINCAWQISSAKNVPVSLIMNRVSLKFGSSVVVYDGTSSRGTVLWSANGATLVVPPVITSTGNSLFIQYRSDTTVSVRYFGFEGDYASNYLGSTGSGKGYTQLKMSSALDISPPGDGMTHSAGLSYVWYVAPSSATGPITFSLSLLRLLQPGDQLVLLEGVSGNTGGDFGGPVQDVAVGSRTVLASYSTGSGLPLNWIRTVGSSATIIFRSPSPTTSMGENFKLSYYADGSNYRCGFTTDPAVLTHPSFILSDGSSSVEGVYGNQACSWQIQPINASSVMLFFSRFHLFGGSLRVYEGSLAQNKLYLEIGSTSAVPAPILIPQAGFSLVYTTQSSASGYGFALTYYGVITPHSFPGDHLVTLTCSSMVSLTLPMNSRTTATASPSTNLTWIVAPSQSNGRIYFALSSLRLSADCDRSYLEIFDGATVSSPLLGRFCGATLPSAYAWLQTSSQTGLVHFVSDGSTNNDGNFDLAFYSDGPNFHCGFDVNPARMTAPSMIFSDGSGSTNAMYGNQLCEWSIEPNTLSGPNNGATSDTLIVLELLQCDMGGAKIELFDGPSTAAALLWSCDGCTSIPAPMISSTSKVYVRFTSQSSAPFGSGFRLVYWTTTATALGRTATPNVASEQVLQLPTDLSLTSGAGNRSEAFHLATSASPSTLSFQPFYTAVAGSVETITASSIDGRVSPTVFGSVSTKQTICGCILNSGANGLTQGDVTYQSTQRLSRFLQTTSEYKSTVAIQAVPRDASVDYVSQRESSVFLVPAVCKYRLNSGSTQAIAITIDNFTPGQNGHLLIYGGLNGSDALIYDSNAPRKYLAQGKFEAYFENGVLRQRAEVFAPCGRATIVLQVNSSMQVTDSGGTDVPLVDHGLRLVYNTVGEDFGQLCTNYYNSLQPEAKKADPYIPVYIGLGGAFAFVLLVATVYYARKLKKAQGYLLYPSDPTFKPRYVPKIIKAPPSYPRYSSTWDQYMNTFLRKGECVVCKNPSITVMRLQCGHGICLEDIKGYLESALGDVSMFPVKCPMHYLGCEGMVESRTAKRVLSEPQYNRFNEFCDRALYGDGMRCIHCANYVNFPEKMDGVARVICPYCQQNFCIRCKKAWHSGNRCAVDTYDESLEAWKNSSGAQKCPACKKLIEKDDPDTCNHMIHKITDGIPCIRDRTDFCYCCGEEITPDYPHNEVRNKNINHFPDGVFQRCRTIVAQEKEAERERLRKMRRMKTKIQPFNASRSGPSTVVPIGADTMPASGESSPVVNRVFSIAAPPASGSGTDSPEALWQLEQNYDIESSPMGSPGRAGLRSSQTTVPGTPATPFLASLGRVISFVDPGIHNLFDESMSAASTRPRPLPTPSGSSRSHRSNRVVPASTATTAAIAAGGTAGIAARPYAPLEQQMMYQNQMMTGMSPARGGSSQSGRNPASSVAPLLLGSPSTRRSRAGTPQTPSSPNTPL